MASAAPQHVAPPPPPTTLHRNCRHSSGSTRIRPLTASRRAPRSFVTQRCIAPFPSIFHLPHVTLITPSPPNAGRARALLRRGDHLRPPRPLQLPRLRLGPPLRVHGARRRQSGRRALRPRDVLHAGESGAVRITHTRAQPRPTPHRALRRRTSAPVALPFTAPQVDTAERGFSFLRDGPLDMRMVREIAPASPARAAEPCPGQPRAALGASAEP